MNFDDLTGELKSSRSYLETIDREKIVHVIKLTIYLIEKDKNNYSTELNESFFEEINKIPLTNDLNNNLFFKYRKKKLRVNSISILEDNDLTLFTNSLFLNFKLRFPMILIIKCNDQKLITNNFFAALKDTEIKKNFIKVIHND